MQTKHLIGYIWEVSDLKKLIFGNFTNISKAKFSKVTIIVAMILY